eukprot:gene8612-7917_t
MEGQCGAHPRAAAGVCGGGGATASRASATCFDAVRCVSFLSPLQSVAQSTGLHGAEWGTEAREQELVEALATEARRVPPPPPPGMAATEPLAPAPGGGASLRVTALYDWD